MGPWFALTSAAATLVVDPSGAADFTTIEAAVEAAASGDTILVEPGSYPERLIIRDKDLTLQSTQGAAVTFVHDGWQSSLILIDNGDVVLDGFDVTSAEIKHCVRVRLGSVVLQNMVIHDCDAYDGLGGGLRIDTGTSAVVRDSEFRDNRAHFTIGARAPHIYSRGEYLEVRDSVFTGGDSDGDCGGVMAMDGDNVIVGNWFEGNVATDDGGGFYADGRANAFLDGSYSDGVSSLVLTDNTFIGNVAGDNGGAVHLIGLPGYTVERNLMCGNAAGARGGGVYLDGAPEAGRFAYNVVQENVASDDGGGLFALGGSPVLENDDFLANEAGDEGGGIALRDAIGALRNNVIAWTVDGDGLTMMTAGSEATTAYDAWWSNAQVDMTSEAVGATDLQVDPQLTAVSFDGDCTNDDWTPVSGSPLVDAGDPAVVDADGTRSDIGAVVLGGAPPGSTTTGTTPGTPPDDEPAPGTTSGPSGDDDDAPVGVGDDPTPRSAGSGCGCSSGAPAGASCRSWVGSSGDPGGSWPRDDPRPSARLGDLPGGRPGPTRFGYRAGEVERCGP